MYSGYRQHIVTMPWPKLVISPYGIGSQKKITIWDLRTLQRRRRHHSNEMRTAIAPNWACGVLLLRKIT